MAITKKRPFKPTDPAMYRRGWCIVNRPTTFHEKFQEWSSSRGYDWGNVEYRWAISDTALIAGFMWQGSDVTTRVGFVNLTLFGCALPVLFGRRTHAKTQAYELLVDLVVPQSHQLLRRRVCRTLL